MEWKYNSEIKKSSGYEEYEDLLKNKYTQDNFKKLSEEKQNDMIDEVFEIYRNKNIYPITYYNEEGIKYEIKRCIKGDAKFDGKVLNNRQNQGKSLCRFMFPSLQKVVVRGKEDNDLYSRFYNDNKLKKAISFALKYDKDARPINILRGLRLIGGGFGSNFSIMRAQALYEYFVPKNGTIYDYSAGFGGRMLGALTSDNIYKYIATEPSIETFNNLKKLGYYIEKVTNRVNSYKLYNKPSENLKLEKNSIDFAFSSPPYFNLEKYSDENTQSYIKYNNLDDWFKGYVNPTLDNIHYSLKDSGLYAVNIADFKLNNKLIRFVDKWIELSKKSNFKLIEEIPMKLTTRRGNGHKKKNKDKYKKKLETIYIFKKKSN